MPVLLNYSSVRFNPGWGIVYTAWHFFRVFNQFKNNVEVEVLPIYYPSPGVTSAAPTPACSTFPCLWVAGVGIAMQKSTFACELLLCKQVSYPLFFVALQ